MKIQDVMCASKVALPLNASIHDLLNQLIQHHVTLIPILDAAERVVGIVTLDDMVEMYMPRYHEMLRDLAALQDKGQIGSLFDSGVTGLNDQEQAKQARDVMQIDIRFVRQEDHLLEAASKLQTQGYTQLPVVDRDQKLVGMISDAQIVLALLSGSARTTA